MMMMMMMMMMMIIIIIIINLFINDRDHLHCIVHGIEIRVKCVWLRTIGKIRSKSDGN